MQSVWLALQVELHMPPWQIWPVVQTVPQLPQLALSLSVVVQKGTPASSVQSVSPPASLASTPPQFVEQLPLLQTWPTEHTVPRDGNIRSLLDVDLGRDDWLPFAIVTPDGQWHQGTECMARSIVEGLRTLSDWPAEARALAQRYVAHVGVMVDCHT